MVGFTAISSKCTAAELVRILNELFANFDKLANKYCQLRIKILGDCYYCICGAPDARPDHAVLCIHMGLAVIEAIKDIQEKIKANVNMRVGIHTGAVLAGVLGQRQWQFDVLGKEVTLANQMESGGVPGRVHISEVTKNCLKDEFELEPGHGDRREDAIRLANITTYLIKSVLRPFPQGTLLANETGGKQVAEKLETNEDKENPKELMANFQRQLHKALIDREKTISVSGAMNWATLFFKDQEMEKKFNQKKEEFSGICMMSLCAVLLLCFTAELCVLPCAVGRVMAFVIGELALITLTVFTLPVSFPKKFPVQLVHVSDVLDNITVVRTLMSLTAVVILVTVPIVPLFECSHPSILNETLTQLHPYDQRCLYSSYTTYLVMTSLVSLALLFQIPYLVKLLLMLCVTALLNVFNIVLVPRLFDLYDSVVHSKSTGSFIPTKFVLCGNSVTFTLVLFYLNRHMEKSARKLFLWKEEAEKQKKQVAELRQKNEALVYNILPHHVAKDFLGSNRNHEELYSNAYEEVGVIFAACPNFNSFYNESSVNNNGLECLRFLNEIISDYDELLSQPQFASITKIKTVGSTYMAASGMTEDQSTMKSVNMKKRWKHLDSIVQFAFCLRDTLEKINTQSFNNFVLRVGLNHGPIIAGVIGAQKPHYDIWGNTVNVSSRMESTGQAGKIQVVEETMLILKEFGYRFEKRGRIKVKGKGELLTFFVENRDTSESSFAMPNQMPES